MKTYQISVDGKQFTGSAEDIARWYCLDKGIKLYIEPIDNDGSMGLCALFPGDDSFIVVAQFSEDEDGVGTDLESGYRAFFTDNLQNYPHCKIVEVPAGVKAPAPQFTPERDLSLAAAAQLASAAIERGSLSSEVNAVVEYVGKIYPRLLSLRNSI